MLNLFNPTKKTLLELVKRHGEVGLEAAEKALDMTKSTVREHFTQLERDGWILHHYTKQKRGRPTIHYSLTAKGDRLFPSGDAHLLRELIGFLQENDEEKLLERFFSTYWKGRVDEVKSQLQAYEGAAVDQKAEALKEILHMEGFMPEYEIDEDNTLIFKECNCPFTEAVRKTRLPCQLEAQFFEEIWESPLERVSYIPDGNAACTYHLKIKPAK